MPFYNCSEISVSEIEYSILCIQFKHEIILKEGMKEGREEERKEGKREREKREKERGKL